MLGRIGFDDKGDVTGYETFVWYVWKDGKYAPVEPASSPSETDRRDGSRVCKADACAGRSHVPRWRQCRASRSAGSTDA